jgi:hypothetical protein
MRRNRKATTAAQVTSDRDQTRMTTANRFKIGNFASQDPTLLNRLETKPPEYAAIN